MFERVMSGEEKGRERGKNAINEREKKIINEVR